MRNIFHKLRTFWNVFWDSVQKAYNRACKDTVQTGVQLWRDIKKVNFLDIFVNKLNNLANTKATFEVVSDSTLTEKLKALCKDIEKNRFSITEKMLGDGDYYIFPAHNSKGEIIHTYLTQEQVRIIDMDGEEIKEAYGIIDMYAESKTNRVYFLLRHHKLEDNGTLSISYSAVTENGKRATIDMVSCLKC